MAWLDGRVDLANLSMVLVLTSAVSSLWVPLKASLAVAAGSVAAFNWLFVPPKHTLSVDLSEHVLLLAAMLAVSWVIAGVMGRQRALARVAHQQRERVQQLHKLGEALRDSVHPADQARLLFEAMSSLLDEAPCLLVLNQALPNLDDDACATVFGEPTSHERSGLWQCLRQGVPFGPGTGRHEELREWYFPLRGRRAAFGAAMVAISKPGPADEEVRAQAQALCDQLGLTLQRAQAQQIAERAKEEAQAQKVRNAMLAAVSHDFRTPLASILGAASAIGEQQARMSAAQQTRLLSSIMEECRHLSRLTDNTLQLARLNAPGVSLSLDWESPQELAGVVVSRFRARNADVPVRLRIEPGTPLVRCDPLLVSQLLENLVDNAAKYAGPSPIELLVRHQPGHVIMAVRDRGPGVAPKWRERIFEVFQRGELPPAAAESIQFPGRSVGVGLAVCRAIAEAHGGELRFRARSHGGSSFECWLPAEPAPSLDAASESTLS